MRALTLILLTVAGVEAQTPAFEVAALKIDDSGIPAQNLQYLPSGQVALRHATLKELIAEAWDLRPEQVAGIPAAYNEERFNVFAKTPPRTTRDDARKMLQTLLSDRFHLSHREEQKELQVYLLTASKKGLKLKSTASPEAEATCQSQDVSKGLVHYSCTNLTLKDLTRALPRMAPLYANLPVVDATEAKGAYDFQLDWAPRVGMMLGSHDTSQFDANGPTLNEILDTRYGLKLEATKRMMPILIVTQVSKPATEN